jgi:hypothetical protein
LRGFEVNRQKFIKLEAISRNGGEQGKYYH